MARLRKRRTMNQINVVPYIDVTLVLLVIFMVTAPMTNPGVVELPKVGSEILKQQTVPIVITVMPNGKIEFQEKQRIGKQVFLLNISAEQYPEIIRIQDMLACTDGFVPSSDAEYESIGQIHG